MSDPHNNASDKVSVLGPTLIFKGELTAEEDLVLKGRVEGSIHHTASLKISTEGSVKGNIKAKYITVEGTVEGDLYATEAVRVKESANITGNIYSTKVSLIEGARFNGSIDTAYFDAASQEAPRAKEPVSSSEPKAAPKIAAAGK
jgi:cytoskeletal protein CcmA (bactofilin family)